MWYLDVANVGRAGSRCQGEAIRLQLWLTVGRPPHQLTTTATMMRDARWGPLLYDSGKIGSANVLGRR